MIRAAHEKKLVYGHNCRNTFNMCQEKKSVEDVKKIKL